MALAEVKDDLSEYPRLAAHQEIVITRHGGLQECSSDSTRRKTGSTTGWSIIRSSFTE